MGVIGENRGPLRSTGIARLHESMSIDPMLTVWEERSVKSCDAYFTVEVVSSFRYKPMAIDIGIRCSRAATENVCCNIHFPGNTYFADSVTSTMYIILLKNRFTGSRTLCDSATYKNLGMILTHFHHGILQELEICGDCVNCSVHLYFCSCPRQ